jgi:hypothetical protein
MTDRSAIALIASAARSSGSTRSMCGLSLGPLHDGLHGAIYLFPVRPGAASVLTLASTLHRLSRRDSGGREISN